MNSFGVSSKLALNPQARSKVTELAVATRGRSSKSCRTPCESRYGRVPHMYTVNDLPFGVKKLVVFLHARICSLFHIAHPRATNQCWVPLVLLQLHTVVSLSFPLYDGTCRFHTPTQVHRPRVPILPMGACGAIECSPRSPSPSLQEEMVVLHHHSMLLS